MKRFLPFLLSLLCAPSLCAQEITGRILDENNAPLSYANAVVLQLPDSTFVTGTTSGPDGRFRLQSTAPNQILSLSFVGYLTRYLPTDTPDLGTIRLEPDAQTVGTVVVKGLLPITRVKGDATVTTVAGSILEKAGTANDLLDKIPGVSASDGSVNVFGSGTAEIYINGRKMRNNSELDRLSSDNIRSVEVVRQPGAQYGAEIKSVVRIFTRKPTGEGLGFTNRAYASYQDGWSYLDQLDLNYRRKGFDLSGMLFGIHSFRKEIKELEQNTFLDRTWTQHSAWESPYRYNDFMMSLSMNYQFNDHHSAGVLYTLDHSPKHSQFFDMASEIFRDGVPYESNMNSILDNNTRADNHSLNVYYTGKLNGWSLDFNADALWNDSREYTLANERSLSSADNTATTHTMTTRSSSDNNLYAAKLLLSHPLWGGSLTLGGEYTFSRRTDRFANDEQTLPSTDNTIRENALSALVEYRRTFGKTNLYAALRYEHLDSEYFKQEEKIHDQSRLYDNFFPSLGLSVSPGKWSLQINYRGGIKRPSYSQLSGDISYGNHYMYEGGNPLLRPALINAVSMGISRQWFFFNMGYKHIKDHHINEVRPYSEQTPTTAFYTFINTPTVNRFDMMLSLAPTIGVWSPQFNLIYQQLWHETSTPTGVRTFNNPTGVFEWKNTLNLPLDFQIGLDASLSTPGTVDPTIFTHNTTFNLDCSLYKGFLKNRLTFQFKAGNLLETNNTRNTIFNTLNTTSLKQFFVRHYSLTVRYKFNPAQSKYRGTGAGESQKQRM